MDPRSEQRMTEKQKNANIKIRIVHTTRTWLAAQELPVQASRLDWQWFKWMPQNDWQMFPLALTLGRSCQWPCLRMVNLLKLTDSPGSKSLEKGFGWPSHGPCPAMPSPASTFGIFRYHSVTSLSSDAHRRQLCRLRTQTFCLICLTTLMQNSPQCLGRLEREKVWKRRKGSPSSFLVPECSLFEHRIQHHFIFW